jgi:hypothetical protein
MEFIPPKECHGCANSADGRNSKFEAHKPTLFNPNVGLISVNESIFRKQSDDQLVHKYSAKHLCADHSPKLQRHTSRVSSLRTTNHPSVNRQVQNLLADTTNNIKTQSHLIPQILATELSLKQAKGKLVFQDLLDTYLTITNINILMQY